MSPHPIQLYHAFGIFGDIERCVVFVDDRGKSKGEGIVEFERKNVALEAVRRCKDGCFFVTSRGAIRYEYQ